MNTLYSTEVQTRFGAKSIMITAQDILDVDEDIDILTTSAFLRDYIPVPNSLFGALDRAGISVLELSKAPAIDLRELCNVWLSREIELPEAKIKRIGCVEMSRIQRGGQRAELDQQKMLDAIKAYFQMLDIAALGGVKMDTVAMPMLGAGSQKISASLTMIPILNECVDFLKRNVAVKRILLIDRNQSNAFEFAQVVRNSYSMLRESVQTTEVAQPQQAMAFISYSSVDRNIADNLCFKLESRGIKVWYAPRNVHDDYASSIAAAIENATYFVIILSEHSMNSQHVLNEIDLAFQYLPNNIKFRPLRIDSTAFAPAFNYYLSRQHWMDACLPPLEARLDEFVDSFFEN